MRQREKSDLATYAVRSVRDVLDLHSIERGGVVVPPNEPVGRSQFYADGLVVGAEITAGHGRLAWILSDIGGVGDDRQSRLGFQFIAAKVELMRGSGVRSYWRGESLLERVERRGASIGRVRERFDTPHSADSNRGVRPAERPFEQLAVLHRRDTLLPTAQVDQIVAHASGGKIVGPQGQVIGRSVDLEPIILDKKSLGALIGFGFETQAADVKAAVLEIEVVRCDRVSPGNCDIGALNVSDAETLIRGSVRADHVDERTARFFIIDALALVPVGVEDHPPLLHTHARVAFARLEQESGNVLG